MNKELEELGRQELLCAEGHFVLHEVVVVVVAVVEMSEIADSLFEREASSGRE